MNTLTDSKPSRFRKLLILSSAVLLFAVFIRQKIRRKIEAAALDQSKMEAKSINQPIFPPLHPKKYLPTKPKPNFLTGTS